MKRLLMFATPLLMVFAGQVGPPQESSDPAGTLKVALRTSTLEQPEAIEVIDIHLHALNPATFIRAMGLDPNKDLAQGRMATDQEELFLRTVRGLEDNNIGCALVQGNNALVAEWVQRCPDRRMLGAFCPDIWVEGFDQMDHVAEAKKFGEQVDAGAYHAIGELLHVYEGIPLDWPVLFPYYAVAEQKGIPVMFHCGNTYGSEDSPQQTGGFDAKMDVNANPRLLSVIAAKFPKLKIVACHAGMESLDELILVMRRYPLVGADISNLNWSPGDPRLVRAFEHFRADGMMHRVYFGSDQCIFPELIGRTVANTRQLLSEEEQRLVFRDNAKTLLGLSK